MSGYHTSLEIHVHGDVPLRDEVTLDQVQDALKPLWRYSGAKSLTAAAGSSYEGEPGIRFDPREHVLQMCWTTSGDEDFRHVVDEVCMGLNDLAKTGAPIEVTFYDADFDDEEAGEDEESHDDFAIYFVGPTPEAIMQVQRDMLVQDVVAVMERHFDGAELGDVVAAIDKLFAQRFDALANCLKLGKPVRNPGAAQSGSVYGSGGGHKPRHLH